jgi:hypothetical protein
MKHVSGVPLYARLLALRTYIRLSWKGLQGTNTLAYYETLNYGHEKFYNICPRLDESAWGVGKLNVILFSLKKLFKFERKIVD